VPRGQQSRSFRGYPFWLRGGPGRED
jgi:hypothetical protein